MRSKIIPEQKKEKKEKAEHPEKSKWAELLKRSFAIEILSCSQCGGRIRVISTIQDPALAKRILNSMGITSEPPVMAPPRAPPQQELSFNQPDDYSQIPPDFNSF